MNNKSETKVYVIGFILSLLLTLAAYFIVVNNVFDGWVITFIVLVLAILQLFVQLSFFLHLWQEENPRWNLVALISTLSIIFLVIIGSIWIMNNLNYRHDLQKDIQNFLEKEGISR